MLLKCLKAEGQKQKRCIIWAVFLLVPVIPAVMGNFNYLNNLDVLTGGWYALWTQHTLFYANLFYGPLISLYCSYEWQLEHRNRNWNSFMTWPVPVSGLYLAKLLRALCATLFLQLWVGVLFTAGGKAAGLSGMPPLELGAWLLRGTAAGMAVASLQLTLSMIIRSFSLPIVISLLGSISGLLLINSSFGIYFPYALMMYGMNANSYDNMLSSKGPAFICSLLFFSLLSCTVGVFWLKKKDIVTG